MKYFQPELFGRTNSPDLDAAMAASDEWEEAAKAYRRRLKTLRKKFPDAVNVFVETLDLHDAEVCGLSHERPDAHLLGLNHQSAMLFVRRPEGIVVLSYQLDSEPKIRYNCLPPELTSPSRHWLYDEFDLTDGPFSSNLFSHEIFLSDGILIKFCFKDFAFKTFPTALQDPMISAADRQRDHLVPV